MKTLLKISLVLSFIIPGIAAAQSRGGGANGSGAYYFEETFFPVYVSRNNTNSITNAPVADETGLGFDLRTTLGYAFWGQALVGLTFNYYSLNTKAPYIGTDDGLKETIQRNEWGPTIGYLNGGWRLLFTYFMSGSQHTNTTYFNDTADTSNVTFKHSELSGFQITAGYSFTLFSNVEIGPTLVYRSVGYKKQSKTNALTPAEDYSPITLHTKAKDSSLDPMLSVLVRF